MVDWLVGWLVGLLVGCLGIEVWGVQAVVDVAGLLAKVDALSESRLVFLSAGAKCRFMNLRGLLQSLAGHGAEFGRECWNTVPNAAQTVGIRCSNRVRQC